LNKKTVRPPVQCGTIWLAVTFITLLAPSAYAVEFFTKSGSLDPSDNSARELKCSTEKPNLRVVIKADKPSQMVIMSWCDIGESRPARKPTVLDGCKVIDELNWSCQTKDFKGPNGGLMRPHKWEVLDGILYQEPDRVFYSSGSKYVAPPRGFCVWKKEMGFFQLVNEQHYQVD